MAWLKTKKICAFPGCARSSYQRYCSLHPSGPEKRKAKRPEYHKLYDRRWRKERKAYLARNPLCISCKERGQVTPAVIVDHVEAHKGSIEKFWNPANWQPLCVRCHNSKTARENANTYRG